MALPKKAKEASFPRREAFVYNQSVSHVWPRVRFLVYDARCLDIELETRKRGLKPNDAHWRIWMWISM